MNEWMKEETFKSMIQISLSVLRFCLLSNGGALVAIMTLLGANSESFVIDDIKLVSGFFVVGLIAGGFAHLFAYLTQLRLHQENMNKQVCLKHDVWLTLAILSVCVSLIVFAIGSTLGVLAFSQ